MKTILFIGGTDPSSGSGVQADLRTATALGAWGVSAITSVVAQNTSRVFKSEHVPPDFLRAQLRSIEKDIPYHAIKIGMIGTIEHLQVIKSFVEKCEKVPVILDPIRFDGTGKTKLSEDEAFFQALHILGPHVSIVTPNTVEASGWLDGEVENLIETLKQFGPDVLLKSGHLQSDDETISDLWCDDQGVRHLNSLPRQNVNPRGTGCHLAAAIAVKLAQGKNHLCAVEEARKWLSEKLKKDLISVGHGRDLLS